MDDHPLADLDLDERNLLAVFARHGRDGERSQLSVLPFLGASRGNALVSPGH
jgi:hypothetical protein